MNSPAWPTLTLGELTESTRPICYGVLKPGREDPNGVPLVRVTDIVLNEFDSRDLIRIAPDLDEEFARSRLDGGEVLISVQGTVGRVAIVPQAFAGSNVSRTIAVVAPDNRVDRRFLYWYLRWLGSRSAFETVGTTRDSLNIATLRRVQVPVPALDEQRRIADILDKADAISLKRKEAIALTEALLRSAFLEMFGDPVSNPKGWPTETIGELCARGAGLVDGPFGSSLKPEHYVDAGVKVVRNWNIYDDRFDFSEFKYVTPAKFEEIRRSEVLPGDVLITTKGTVGDVCVAPDLGGPAVLSASGTVRLRVPPDDSFLPEFVVAQMTTSTYKRYLHTFEAGSAQQYLNLSAIRKMRLIRPPVEAQGAFRAFRARVRHANADAAVAHTESDHLFSSLVERAFSGGPAC
ncbi:restriction endonuclease subunit S [Myxococcus sp. AB025B]|uniref:restriction endonuclease subunit S n=1 Tax=Myxococcus sp. AB025B TaxID=2562794 RepID=UPI001143E694|nr:restriction endonuclease subunit S [Myxococcus sp. AB025B]